MARQFYPAWCQGIARDVLKKAIRLDAEGYVHLSHEPGMGYRIIWDYIEPHRIIA